MKRAIFSEERPNSWRRRRAIWIFSFSISSVWVCSPTLAAASSGLAPL
jgi:hypothetical protein